MNYDVTFIFLKQLVHMLGQLLGNHCEVVLHDVRHPESSIIAIEHGDITGRKVGDPSTNLGLPVLQNPYGEYDAFNYRSTSPTGRPLKSSSIYLKDDEGKVFAALCVNWDISSLSAAANILQDLMRTNEVVEESYVNDIQDLISTLVQQALETVNKPIDAMNKEDKLRVMDILDKKGVFIVKRSLDQVANLLGISRATAYGYLNEIQAKRDGSLFTARTKGQ
jgi:predicted transcriptional regulator YheO